MLGKFLFKFFSVMVVVALSLSTVRAVEIETVPVGNPGNANDPETGYGAVDYEYNIGKYEVTAGQYAEFLNAVAATDTYGLYNTWMDSSSHGCQITQKGISGGYTYDFSGAPNGTASDWEDRPVNFVTWYNAAMFCNWLTSGEVHRGAYNTCTSVGWGDSEASNYTGTTPHNSAEMDALRSTYGKVWVIPTEDEWYKAAYHKNDGSTGNYFNYPTSSDIAPEYVTNSCNLSGTGASFTEGGIDPGNYATYDGDGGINGIGSPYYRTVVGEWENSESPYGTFDQGGNLWEWNEAILSGSFRGVRGGPFRNDVSNLRASFRIGSAYPTHPGSDHGFRVACIPEPLLGDLDGNGFVGGHDLDIVRVWWGFEVTPGELVMGDPSGDGFVGGDDLDILRANWGQGEPPAPRAIPEPGILILLFTGLAEILLTRRH